MFGAVNRDRFGKIKENASRPYTVGNKIARTTAEYTINLGTPDGGAGRTMCFNLMVRADYRITGPTWFHTVQNQERPTLFSGLLPGSALMLPAVVGNARYDVARREAFGVLNLRVGLEGERWKVTAFANNLLDRRYLNEVIPAIEFGGSFISPGQRQQLGVEVGLKF